VTGEPCRSDELRTLVAAILAAAWRVTSAVMSAPREQAGAAGRIIECHNTPHSGCGDTQRPAGTFPGQALTSRRGGGRTRCTMNKAGAARLLAVVVLIAQVAQHLAGHPTWRGFGEFATMSGWRDRDGTLESTSGSAPSWARSGYSLRWASTSSGLPR